MYIDSIVIVMTLVFAIGAYLYSTRYSSIVKRYSSGETMERIVCYRKLQLDVTEHAHWWYENGDIELSGHYKNNKREGWFYGYHKNGYGQKKSEKLYVNNRQEGLETWWHENGRKSSEGAYKNDKREGLFVSWCSDGKKWQETHYEYGLPTLETWWHENGQKWKVTHYREGGNEWLRNLLA